MDIRPEEICPLVWWVQIWVFWFRPSCLCEMQSRWLDALRMSGSHVKHGGGSVMVWGCFAADPVCDLFRIQDTLNQQGYHSILQRYAIPSGLHLVGLSFVFQQVNDPTHTSRLCKGYLTKKESDECCIRWPGLHNHPTSTQLSWFGVSWTAEWRKSSHQVLSICRNSFKTVGKAFQVKLVERMLRVCKAVIKAKGGYFEESKL